MRKDFNGKSFDFMMMTTWTPYGVGTTFHFKENLKEGSYCVGEPFGEHNFWVKNLNDEFQNEENVYRGLSYIDGMDECGYKDKLMSIVHSMMGANDSGMSISRKIGFLCELGVWEDEKIRQSHLYDKEFYKYARKCMNQYGF